MLNMHKSNHQQVILNNLFKQRGLSPSALHLLYEEKYTNTYLLLKASL